MRVKSNMMILEEGQLFNKIEHSDYEEEIHQEDLEIVDADEKEED
jgi:hypothetical protein